MSFRPNEGKRAEDSESSRGESAMQRASKTEPNPTEGSGDSERRLLGAVLKPEKGQVS